MLRPCVRLLSVAAVAGLLIAAGAFSGGRSSQGGSVYQFGPAALWHNYFCVGMETCLTGDFDGDGKDDVVTFLQGASGDVYVALSDGDSFNPDPVTTLWSDLFCVFGEICDVGDFNGDGKDDVVAFVYGSTEDVWVALSDGSSFGTPTKWHESICIAGSLCTTGDFNGDGMDDVIAFFSPGGDVYVALSNGGSFLANTVWHSDFCNNLLLCYAGDFDGNGVDDIAQFYPGGGDVALEGGGQFVDAETWLVAGGCGSAPSQACAIGDYNGDGADDFTSFSKADTGDVEVFLSSGVGFDYYGMWHDFFCIGNEVCGTGDFDGDGSNDVVTFLRDVQGPPGQGDVYVGLGQLVEAPENDDLADATEGSPLPFLGIGLTHGATEEGGEALMQDCGVQGSPLFRKTVWYKYTSPGTGLLTAETTGSSYDTVLAVYSGPVANPMFGNVQFIACNDDVGGPVLQSRVEFGATAGTTYYFQMGGFDAMLDDPNGGILNFRLDGDLVTPTATGTPPAETPTATATGTATPTPTGGPTATPIGKLTQGNVDCDEDVDTVDALKQQRHVADLAVQQEPGCPEIASGLARAGVGGQGGAVFGDVDCDGDVDAVDSLKVLRFVAGLPVDQMEPCRDIGEEL